MEHLPLNIEGPQHPAEKPLNDIKITASRLFIDLGVKGWLDKWGDAIGEPNPDMKAYLPLHRRRTRKEKSEERQPEPPPVLNKIEPWKVSEEVKEHIAAWKLEHQKDFSEEEANRVWEEMTNHLLARGRTRLHNVILQVLYGLEI